MSPTRLMMVRHLCGILSINFWVLFYYMLTHFVPKARGTKSCWRVSGATGWFLSFRSSSFHKCSIALRFGVTTDQPVNVIWYFFQELSCLTCYMRFALSCCITNLGHIRTPGGTPYPICVYILAFHQC